MESKTFVKLLRKIIREEVSKAVKQVLNESKFNQVTNSDINLSEISADPMPNRPVAKKKYTKKFVEELIKQVPKIKYGSLHDRQFNSLFWLNN